MQRSGRTSIPRAVRMIRQLWPCGPFQTAGCIRPRTSPGRSPASTPRMASNQPYGSRPNSGGSPTGVSPAVIPIAIVARSWPVADGRPIDDLVIRSPAGPTPRLPHLPAHDPQLDARRAEVPEPYQPAHRSVIPACHTPNGWRRCPFFPACAGRAKRSQNLRKSGLTPSVCSEVADRGHLSPQCLRLAFLIHGDPKWVLRTAAAAHVGRSTSSTARLVSVSRLLWSPDTDCTLSQTPDPVLRLANATHSSIWRDEARHVAKRDPRQR